MRKISLAIISAAALSVFCCHAAYALRPLSTEDGTVADKGAIELEMGLEYTKAANDDDNYNMVVVPNYGLTDNVQLCVELPFDVIRPENGGNDEDFSDITLAAKTLIFPEGDILPSILIKTAVKLSNGDEDEGFGSGDEDVALILAATKTIGPAAFHANIGYTFVGDDFDASLDDTILYGIGLEYQLFSGLSMVCEVFGEGDPDLDEDDTHVLSPLIGLRYEAADNVTFDAAYKMNIQDSQKPEFGVISGVSMGF